MFYFEYLSWHDEIKKIIKSNYNNIAINWFIKNKKKKDWKYQKKDGGGVIRFYGIHMIKLFQILILIILCIIILIKPTANGF